MLTEPLLSIIMPVYNRISLIPETIDNIIEQTYKNWELIIIDDGSNTETLDLLYSYEKKDGRIKVLQRNREPRGAQTCRNTGLFNAKGDLVIFTDSDDLFETTCFEHRSAFMVNNPTLDFAIFPGLIFTKEKFDKNLLISAFKGKDIIPMFLGLTPPFVLGNVIWKRKSLIENNITWDENVKAFQDLDFHLTAAYKNLPFTYSNTKPDYFWRKHNEGNTGSELSNANKLSSHQYFFKKHVGILEQEHLYDRYKAEINRLAGQLILLAFQSENAADVHSMVTFLKQFGTPFTKLQIPVLVKLGKLYKRGSVLKALARINVFFLYPSVFPLFKNKDFARVNYTP